MNNYGSDIWPKKEKPLNEKIGNWFVGLAIVVLFILALEGSYVDKDRDKKLQRDIYGSYGYQNGQELAVEVDKLASEIPRSGIAPADFYKWLVRVRIAEQAAEDFQKYYWNDSYVGVEGLAKQLKSIDGRGCAVISNIRFSYGEGMIQEGRQIYQTAINVSRVPLERVNLGYHLLLAYFLSVLLMGVLMGMKAKNMGDRPLSTEMLTPQRLPLAMLAWPITAWAYPYGTPLQSLKYATRFAANVLVVFLSLGTAGMAKAQTQTGSKQNTKNAAGYVVQSDTRYGLITGGVGPDPQRQERLTVTSPSGWMTENVLQSNDKSWNLLSTWGRRIFRDKKFSINFVPGFRITHNKLTKQTDKSLLLNTQVFTNIPLPKKTPLISAIVSANPVIQVERGVAGSGAGKRASFTWVNQTFAKLKRFNLFTGWEASIGKATNRPMTYSTGPLLEWQTPKKNWPRFGVGYLWNQAGAHVLRFRLTQTFSF